MKCKNQISKSKIKEVFSLKLIFPVTSHRGSNVRKYFFIIFARLTLQQAAGNTLAIHFNYFFHNFNF